MAKEKFIRGKRDNCNHDGLYANRKREQQADYELKLYLEEVEMQEGIEYYIPMRNSANEIVRNKSPWNQQPQTNPNS